MKEVYIYGLVCPITNNIKYVGKTIQRLELRLKGHICLYKHDITYRANWIRSLKDKGLKPNIILIEVCNENNWEEREIYWIAYYSKLFVLTNHQKGGGNGNHVVKISTRENMSIAGKERWKDTEYKEKMCNMSKELWKNEDYRKNRINEIGKDKIRQCKLGTKLKDETKNKIGVKSKKLWDDNRERFVKTRFKKAIIIDNIEYESSEAAAKIFNVNPSTISRRIQNKKFPNYNFK